MNERATRKRITDRTLAAHLVARVFEIPHEHQKLLHEDQVLSLIERDHWPVPVAEGGTNHFSNVWARLIADHREKTRTVDVPTIAKNKRIRRNEMIRRYNAAAKIDPEAADALYPAVARLKRRKAKILSRPFQKQYRPMQSRGFQRRRQ